MFRRFYYQQAHSSTYGVEAADELVKNGQRGDGRVLTRTADTAAAAATGLAVVVVAAVGVDGASTAPNTSTTAALEVTPEVTHRHTAQPRLGIRVTEHILKTVDGVCQLCTARSVNNGSQFT